MKKFDRFLANLKTQVKGITDDSRNVKKAYVFVAIKGLTSDGHKFISQARENGAKIVIGENGNVDIKVSDSRQALSLIASSFYDHPSKKMKMVGITGTDGKTTTSTLIHWILKTAGKKAGLISTVSAKVGSGKEYDTGFHTTNPDPLPLQEFLFEMTNERCEYSVLEVTSHGLDQERVYGIDFDIGVLTNITHEHLDYHKTFENYVKAKSKLFQNSKICIINKSYFKYFKKSLNKNRKIILYDKNSLDAKLLKVVNAKFKEDYNVLNATAAILVAKKVGVSDSKIIKAIKTFKGVEGRMQEIKNKLGVKIIVDFAHTPNALESLLTALRKNKQSLPLRGKNKLICVFGCAGERDVKKRPMMGEISTRLADISIFTAEDPRHEDVNQIIRQMKSGIKRKNASFFEILDRLEAIKYAINIAKKGDIVVVCGKGHERSMNFNGVEYPWQDKKAIKSILGKSKKVSAIILAAGKGSRMGGKMPKVLLSIGGESILSRGLNKIKHIGIDDMVVVIGFRSDQVADAVKEIGQSIKIVRQGRKTGTGGATISGLKKISKISDTVLVIYGDDFALYRKKTLQRFIKHYLSQDRPITVAVIKVKGVSPLGGLEINQSGDVVGVLVPDEITSKGDKETVVLCGLLCFNKYWLLEKIKLIPKNPKSGEYSLPYLLKIANSEGNAAKPFFIKDGSEWNSVNTPTDLKVARKKGQNKWKE